MIKLIFGSLIAAVAMFFAGFAYFGGPFAMAGYHSATENQNAVLQEALKANLFETGTYMVPEPTTQTGTILYGNGPVATVHYNASGFPVGSTDSMIWGFVLYLVVALFMAVALSQLDRRVPDFKSRAIIVLGFAFAASALIVLGDPIWLHQDWRYAVFNFVGDVFMLSLGGLILARWFLPTKAELAATAPASVEAPALSEAQEAGSGQEIPATDGTRV